MAVGPHGVEGRRQEFPHEEHVVHGAIGADLVQETGLRLVVVCTVGGPRKAVQPDIPRGNRLPVWVTGVKLRCPPQALEYPFERLGPSRDQPVGALREPEVVLQQFPGLAEARQAGEIEDGARRVVHPGEPAQGRARGGPGSCVARRWGITSPGDKGANAGDEDRF